MNQQLTDLIINWVNKAGGAIGQGLDFAIQQAPEIFEQYMAIKAIEAIQYTAICVVFVVIGFILVLLGIFKKMDDEGICRFISFVVGLIMLLVSFGVGFSSLAEYCKIKEAPKAYMMMKVA